MPTKPDWGVGRVVSEPAMGKVSVLFREAGEKVLSLKHAHLSRVEGEAARDLWLDSLSCEPSTPELRYVGPREAIRCFLERYPDGFRGARFAEEVRQPRVAAHQAMVELLDREAIQERIAAQEFREVGKRALVVVAKTNLVYPVERTALARAIKDPEQAPRFAHALADLLYGEDGPDVRFRRYCEALAALKAGRWTLATYFPFVRHPAEHMLLKPSFTQQVAALCRFDLHYRPEPNGVTYGRLLAFARLLRDVVLADLGPADMFDVQGFIWSLSQDRD